MPTSAIAATNSPARDFLMLGYCVDRDGTSAIVVGTDALAAASAAGSPYDSVGSSSSKSPVRATAGISWESGRTAGNADGGVITFDVPLGDVRVDRCWASVTPPSSALSQDSTWSANIIRM